MSNTTRMRRPTLALAGLAVAAVTAVAPAAYASLGATQAAYDAVTTGEHKLDVQAAFDTPGYVVARGAVDADGLRHVEKVYPSDLGPNSWVDVDYVQPAGTHQHIVVSKSWVVIDAPF